MVNLSNMKRTSATDSGYVATTYDDNKLQSNIALLGFKCAVNGSLAKYNLQDQIIDEFTDATGIDAGNSTNEVLSSGAYYGETAVTPTVTNDADSTGVDGDYTWYKWTDTAATGSYNTDTTQDHEWLIIGGGGSGGKSNAGGGGAGGYRAGASLSLTGGNSYTVTVGAGGASQTTISTPGNDGSNSILSGTGITTITSTGGGGGGGNTGGVDGRDGGSGGGSNYEGGSDKGSGNTPSITQYTAAGETTTVQGNDGGEGGASAPEYGGGGGGGAGAAGGDGTTSNGGVGGVGVANDITGSSVYYAGGGGGSTESTNSAAGAGGNGGGGAGGGGATAGTNATVNTGGGGGAGHGGNSGAGGSGIVILRRSTDATGPGGNLTLQSIANTSSSAATKADLIMLMENAYGTATINVDIKGYVTADGGSNWTEGTLVDEGSWGTNKKIYAFHDVTVTSGTDMRYKITTHNQSNGTKETKIHATSIGWKA